MSEQVINQVKVCPKAGAHVWLGFRKAVHLHEQERLLYIQMPGVFTMGLLLMITSSSNIEQHSLHVHYCSIM